MRKGEIMKAHRLATLALALLVAYPTANAALLDTPWSGGGTGTTVVVSDGQTPPAAFNYDARAYSGNWTFGTVAAYDRTVLLKYTYNGLHAWFMVTAGLDAVAGADVYPLVDAGPVNCCTPPSNYFSYTGVVALPVAAGESYGFAMRGSNYDINNYLIGSLVVDEVSDKDACKDDGWMDFTSLAGTALFMNQGDCVSFMETNGRNDPGRNIP
jgi:hypothetical protein